MSRLGVERSFCEVRVLILFLPGRDEAGSYLRMADCTYIEESVRGSVNVTLLLLLYSNITGRFLFPFLCYAEFLPELTLPFRILFCCSFVFLCKGEEHQHLLWLRKDCKALKGPLGLPPGCIRQQRIHVLLNYGILWPKEAAREHHACWLLAQLLKHLFTDFKHQLSLLQQLCCINIIHGA